MAFNGIFGKQKSPDELSKEWIKELKSQQRQIQQQIRKAERENHKLKAEMKVEAKRAQGDPQMMKAVKILAKGVVQSNQNIARLYNTKTQINSAVLGIKEQQASLKMAKTMQKSAKITASMSHLVKVGEVQESATKMAMEMQKMGIIQEMVDDAFESVEPEDMEEDAEKIIDQVVFDVTNVHLSEMTEANKDLKKDEEKDKDEDEDEENMQDLNKRLQALSS